MESAESAAMVTNEIEVQKLSCPVPDSAPAASTTGSDGIGKPNCSAKTHASSTTYPCLIRNSSVLCIEPGQVLAKQRWFREFYLEKLLRDEVSSMTPLAAHDKFANRFADSRRGFPAAVRLRKGGGLARMPHGKTGDGVPPRGHF